MRNMSEVIEYKEIEKACQPAADEYLVEQYPGILCFREFPERIIDLSEARCEGESIVRLHLELIRSEDRDEDHQKFLEEDPQLKEYEKKEMEEQIRVLRSYGKLKYGQNISRDIAVPVGMPLYALHYVIQRAFGWQNSHLHHFELPDEVFKRITGEKVANWMELVGVLLQPPMMDDEDRFWADDYKGGSFKNWLRKKYTGPYMSLNHGEGIVQSKADVAYIKKECSKLVVGYKLQKDGRECIVWVSVAQENEDLTVSKQDKSFGIVRKEIISLEDLPVESLFTLFEDSPNQLLERLSIDQVLAFRDKGLHDQIADTEEIRGSFEDLMDEDLRYDIDEILGSGQDEPWLQPLVTSCTDTLYYNYDYGDNWCVKITGSLGCEDLVKEGRITQDEIDEAILAIYDKYKPVCLAVDGLPVLDDVGGISGYIRFLRGINKAKENEYWKKVAKENDLSEEEYLDMIPDNWEYDNIDPLEWAKDLGWNGRMPGRKTLL